MSITEAAENFAEDNMMRRGRSRKVSNSIPRLIQRTEQAMHREQFTRTTPVCKAKLDGPLTLEKCLSFQNKYDVEVSYISDDLKAEMKFQILHARYTRPGALPIRDDSPSI